MVATHGWEVQPTNTGSADDVRVVGRVCMDAAGAARTSESSLMLEGSRATSHGARVPLDLSLMRDFSLFPGQVVAVRGRNPTGSSLTAHEILDALPPLPAAQPADEDKHARAPLRLVVAAGPFTRPDNLLYEPLHAVIQYCAEHVPGALLLCGPFVPDSHAQLPLAPVPFQELFEAQVRAASARRTQAETDMPVSSLAGAPCCASGHDVTRPAALPLWRTELNLSVQVLAPLQLFQQAHPDVRIMLQPSVTDAHHIPVHPQPPLPPASGIDMLTCPAHVSVAGCSVSASHGAVIMDLSAREVSRSVRRRYQPCTQSRRVLVSTWPWKIFAHKHHAWSVMLEVRWCTQSAACAPCHYKSFMHRMFTSAAPNCSTTHAQKGARDRIAGLCGHLLKQRSAFPTFPPAADACIDFSHWRGLELAAAPELFVLPSVLPPCAKVVTQPAPAAPMGATHLMQLHTCCSAPVPALNSIALLAMSIA